MRLSAVDIANLTAEIQDLAVSGQIQRVYDGRPGEIVLHLRRPGETFMLLLAAGTPAARLHLIEREPEHPLLPCPFVFLLRKHLIGSRLDGAKAVEGDRVAVLDLWRRYTDDTGEPVTKRYRLVAELTGRHGNLFLLDGEDLILGSLRANVSYRRKLVSGELYRFPDRPEGVLVDSVVFTPGSSTDRLSRRVETTFNSTLEEEDQARAMQELLGAIHRAERRMERRLDAVGADLAKATRADELNRWGQLLQSAYGKVSKGATSVRVPDYFEPDMPLVEVPLDPASSLGENIARYFKDGRRLKDARLSIQRRRDETEDKLLRLRQARSHIEGLDPTDREQLEPIRGQLEKQGLLEKRTRPQPPKRLADRALTPPYIEYVSADGNLIRVGRGARQNDQLTFRVARGQDLWLHASSAGGAHVIVCLAKGEILKPETLIDAATLAIHHSHLKGEKFAEVRYTWQRNVHKLKGAPAGEVTVAQSKVFAVERQEERLQRLLATRKS